MIKAGGIDKGMYLLIKNEPHVVTEREFVSPGKGSAFVRLKLKNLRNGQNLKTVMRTPDSVEEISVEERPAQYLYSDGESYHFMDNETYDQFEIPFKGFEDKIYFLKEGDTYRISKWDVNYLDIILPIKMVLLVTEAQEAIKGDTVTGSSKLIKLETGLEVKAPLFIKAGEKVMVNTETKEYVERVNS